MKTLIYDNKLKNLKNDTFIINNNPFEGLIEVIEDAQVLYNIKYVYAHNGGKFDTVLMLSYIINNNITIKYDTLYNSNILL